MQRLLNATRCTFLVITEKVEMKECLEPTIVQNSNYQKKKKKRELCSRGVKWVDNKWAGSLKTQLPI